MMTAIVPKNVTLTELERKVERWLEDSRLPPEHWPKLSFVEVAALAPNLDTRPVFTQPTVAIQAGSPGGGVRIRWDVAPAEALVDELTPEATIFVTPAVYVEADTFLRSMMLVVLLFAMRRRESFHVHAAALESPAGEGWLIAGNSGGGKSTTTALLARNGWRVSTEDIAFIEPAGTGVVSVRGFRSRLALRPGGAELLKVTDGVAFADRGKLGVWPEEMGGGWTPTIVPRVLVFTRVGDGPTRVERIPAMEAMRGLLQWSMWILFESVGASEHLALLTALTTQCRAFNVQLGKDLFDNPRLLEEAVR